MAFETASARYMERPIASLVQPADAAMLEEEWAGLAFPHRVRGIAYDARLSRDAVDGLSRALMALRPEDVSAGADLSAGDPFREEDDVGVVRTLDAVSVGRYLTKRVRLSRVPTPFHEPYVAEHLRLVGVPTVRFDAVITRGDEVFLIMRHEEPHVQLRGALADARQRSTMLIAIARALGGFTRRLISSDIMYFDFDLKNILVSPSSENEGNEVDIIFCDFERAQQIRGQSSVTSYIETLRASAIRRLRRVDLRDDVIVAFIRGLFDGGWATVRVDSLARWLSERCLADQPLVVAVDGLAGAGKSTLASSLHRTVARSVVFESDWFVKYDRETRSATGFAIPHGDWYDVDAFLSAVETFRSREHVTLKGLYSHHTGLHDLDVSVDARLYQLLIVEGMYATKAVAGRGVDVAIVLSVSPELARGNFLARDTVRGISDAAVSARREAMINSPVVAANMALAASHSDIVLGPVNPDEYAVLDLAPRVMADLPDEVGANR